VGDHHHPLGKQAKTYQPCLSILDTVVDEGDAASVQHVRSIGKVQAVLFTITSVLRAVPFVLQESL
jgi:hypothetical protein